jgi:outer membrane immunogenic protein
MNYAFVNSLRLSVTAALAFAAFSAQAADMYAPRGSMKDFPLFEPTWSGFYLGVNSGYGWGAKSSTLDTWAFDGVDPVTFLPTAGTLMYSGTSKLQTEGGFGGGQLGYNLQRDRFVFGVETDIQGAAIKGNTFSKAFSTLVPPATVPTLETEAWARSTLDWFGTVRGRLGYSAGSIFGSTFGNTLLYATGGFAFGGARDSLGGSLTSLDAVPGVVAAPLLPNPASRNSTLTGWVVGGGVEVALSPSWSAKAEYQYIDLGSTTLTAANHVTDAAGGGVVDGGSSSIKFDHTYNTVRLGLNYRFNQAYEPLK